MSTSINNENSNTKVAIIPILAALVALVGLGDAIYLTAEHYKGELPPCSIVQGCEIVLTSAWSEIAGVPLALFGAVAYFVAFSLALLAGFGNRTMWTLFGIHVTLMTLFSGFLLYQQAFVIGAFCQFCLLSAGVTFTMFILFIVSKLFRK